MNASVTVVALRTISASKSAEDGQTIEVVQSKRLGFRRDRLKRKQAKNFRRRLVEGTVRNAAETAEGEK